MLPRILIVDDERDNLDALKRLLRKEFDVVTALSGEEGLEVLSSQKSFDVIVSDQRMPGMQGSDFLERARESVPLATRILLTGFSDVEAMIEAVNRGQIWRYVSKPWEPDDFRQTMKQAADRCRLEKSLQQSRVELERALNELRAKDWARERLLQILLHEFRTAPQILQGLKDLDPGGADAASRIRFIDSLEKRFSILEGDIANLLAEEKRITALPKEPIAFVEFLKDLDFLQLLPPASTPGNEPAIIGHRQSLAEALAHLHNLVSKNSLRSPVVASVDWTPPPQAQIFLSLRIEDPTRKPLPEGLSQQKIDSALAWNALLEPFVGSEDFAHHSTGLRIDTARVVRHLAALGARCEFQISGNGQKVELLISFKGAQGPLS